MIDSLIFWPLNDYSIWYLLGNFPVLFSSQDTLFNVYVNCSVNVETSGCPSGLRSDAAQDFIDSYLRTGNKGLQIYQGLTTTNTDLNLLANVVEYTDCKKKLTYNFCPPSLFKNWPPLLLGSHFQKYEKVL